MDRVIVKTEAKPEKSTQNSSPNQEAIHIPYLLGKGKADFSNRVSLGISATLQGRQTQCLAMPRGSWTTLAFLDKLLCRAP